MARVTVVILHPVPGPGAGPLVRLLAELRADLAERHAVAFSAAGADDIRIVTGSTDDTPFGERLGAHLAAAPAPGGLIVLGSGALPLAEPRDHARLVAVAAAGGAAAFTNNRYSADVVAVGRGDVLGGIPGTLADNALPRWLAGRGIDVHDVRDVSRLQVDLDAPADAFLIGGRLGRAAAAAARRLGIGDVASALRERVAAVRAVTRDPAAELLVAGRMSSGTLRRLERGVAARVRALVEERGMRTAPAGQRPPASALGMALDTGGAAALGTIVARLSEAAVVDSRVLLAHRLGRDEHRWPGAEDRFASDLLLPDLVGDPWLRALTTAAREAPVPILLGGHTLVGPGLGRILAPARAAR